MLSISALFRQQYQDVHGECISTCETMAAKLQQSILYPLLGTCILTRRWLSGTSCRQIAAHHAGPPMVQAVVGSSAPPSPRRDCNRSMHFQVSTSTAYHTIPAQTMMASEHVHEQAKV